MLSVLEKSICSASGSFFEEVVLVKKTNLLKILDILDEKQRIQVLAIFGLCKPDTRNLEETSRWANEAMVALNLKCKELATEADVSPCDVSYLLNNNEEKLSGKGRREKIINKLYEKLENKFSDALKQIA